MCSAAQEVLCRQVRRRSTDGEQGFACPTARRAVSSGAHMPPIEPTVRRHGGAASRWKSPAEWACKRRVSRVSAMCQRHKEGIGP
jgi:hypothetical protein